MVIQLVVSTGNRVGQVIPVSGEKFIIGRAEDCHLRPRSELISRYHCAILTGDEIIVRDLGSKNGVRLNGIKIETEHKLNNGDRLAIGPLEFFVHIIDSDSMEDGEDQGDGSDSDRSSDLLDYLSMINNETIEIGQSESGLSDSDKNERLKKFL